MDRTKRKPHRSFAKPSFPPGILSFSPYSAARCHQRCSIVKMQHRRIQTLHNAFQVSRYLLRSYGRMSTLSNKWVDKKYPSRLLQTGQLQSPKGFPCAFEEIIFHPSLADAVTRGPDNLFYFAEPFVEQMTMAEFLSRLSAG